MIQADNPLNQKPRDINLDGLEMDWKDLRERILESHKSIVHLFFKGIGNELQFKDSQIAENVMLQYTDRNIVSLPVHDSFILREGLAGDLEETMRRAFYDEFGEDIGVSKELVIERVALFDGKGNPRTAEVIKDDREYSQWYDRNTLWLCNLKAD